MPTVREETAYEGGVAGPLIVAGPGIEAGAVKNPLAHAVDLFATIIELGHGDTSSAVPQGIEIDSASMKPHLLTSETKSARDWVLTEIRFGPQASFAMRDERYKLVIKNKQEE